MNRECEFIRECGAFFVLTVNDDFPAGRPFGAVMELDNDLYISTADTKEVYKQLKKHEHMQIVALKPGTRKWIRVSGSASECTDLKIKQKMLEECPALSKHYSCADEPHYNVFQVKIIKSEFHI